MFLKQIRPHLKCREYQIAVNSKNKEFDRIFNLRDAEKKEILESLTKDDCISVDKNNNQNYEDSEVFIFLKKVNISIYGENTEVELYIKMYLKNCDYFDMVIVISFHKSGEYE